MDGRTTDTRRRLIEAALRAIDAKGWGELTVAGLARECGVSPPAAYKHFADKDALMVAALEAVADGLGEQARECLVEEPRESLLGIAERIIGFAQEHPGLHDFLLSPWAVRRLRAGRGASVFAFLEGASRELERLLPDALPAERDRVFFALWSYVHGYAAFVAAGVLTPEAHFLRACFDSLIAIERTVP